MEEVKHPGLHLKSEIDKLGMSVNEFSFRTLIPLKTLNKIISGDANFDSEIAKKISMFFDNKIETWMNMQTRYDEYLIEKELDKNMNEEVEIVKLLEKDFLKKVLDKETNINVKAEVVKDLRVKFMVNSLLLLKNDLYKLYKPEDEVDEKELILKNAFISYSIYLTNHKRSKDFDYKNNTELIQGLKKLTFEDHKNQIAKFKDILKKYGITLVITPFIKDSNIGSFIKYMPSENGVIMSISDKYSDAYLFIYHILLGLAHTYKINKNVFNIISYKEKADSYAIKYANDAFIDSDEYDYFVHIHDFQSKAVDIFSKKMNVAKYIVVGRLRMDKLIKQADLKKENKEYKF